MSLLKCMLFQMSKKGDQLLAWTQENTETDQRYCPKMGRKIFREKKEKQVIHFYKEKGGNQ